MLRKGDLILISFLAVIIIGSYFGFRYWSSLGGNTHKIAVVKQADREIARIDLDTVQTPYQLEVKGEYYEVLKVEKGRIRFLEADCPDKVCVKTGWLSRKGDTAVCLPNRTIIKMEGESGNVDVVAY